MRALVISFLTAASLIALAVPAAAKTAVSTQTSQAAATSEARAEAERLCAMQGKSWEQVQIRIEKEGEFYTAILTYRCV